MFRGRYAALYDTLYADKDYEAEATYVADRLRAAAPNAKTILEFGSGTGRHGKCLNALGFEVNGIERSIPMLERARTVSPTAQFQQGDMRTVRLGRSFDSVIALFHVVSYLTSDDDILNTFRTARTHLRCGGPFLFDFWYGPAVLSQKPETRLKEITTPVGTIVRVARTSLETTANEARVNYTLFIRSSDSSTFEREDEMHTMRYLFLTEVKRLLEASGFHLELAEEGLTRKVLDTTTWGATVLARAV